MSSNQPNLHSRGLRKYRPTILTVGDTVTIGRDPEHHTITAVEYVEHGSSRFDFYRVSGDDRRFARADLKTVSI